MADSNITKRALADSLKVLMSEHSFSKISIGDICGRCEMNRKSFYYHFRDKYDLVNWIFEREFVAVSKVKAYNSVWDAFSDLCEYLYANKDFYRNAFKIGGQNSFGEYFFNTCKEMFTKRLHLLTDDRALADFQSKFLAEAMRSTFDNWVSSKECMPPQEFSEMVRASVLNMSTIIVKINS